MKSINIFCGIDRRDDRRFVDVFWKGELHEYAVYLWVDVELLQEVQQLLGRRLFGQVMGEAARRGFSTATDLADYLVRLGLPFRDAHDVVGKAVAHGIASGQDLAEMELATLQGFCGEIREDVFEILTMEGSVAARNHLGGTAPGQVAEAARRASALLATR